MPDEIILNRLQIYDKYNHVAKKWLIMYSFKMDDYFGYARNYSFQKATKDYMWLDAVDVLRNED